MTFEIPQEWLVPLLVVGGILGYILIGIIGARICAMVMGITKSKPTTMGQEHTLVLASILWPIGLLFILLFMLIDLCYHIAIPKDKEEK